MTHLRVRALCSVSFQALLLLSISASIFGSLGCRARRSGSDLRFNADGGKLPKPVGPNGEESVTESDGDDLIVEDCTAKLCDGDVDINPLIGERETLDWFARVKDLGVKTNGEVLTLDAANPTETERQIDELTAILPFQQRLVARFHETSTAWLAVAKLGAAMKDFPIGRDRTEKLRSIRDVAVASKDILRVLDANGSLASNRQGDAQNSGNPRISDRLNALSPEVRRIPIVARVLQQAQGSPQGDQGERVASRFRDMVRFLDDNVGGDTFEEKADVFIRLLDIAIVVTEIQKAGGIGSAMNMDDNRLAQILEEFKFLAGDDQFLNRGDGSRILPAIPSLVASVADQKIQEGYEQGIQQLAAEHPLAYRRWRKRPNGLIGGAVSKRIDQALTAAYAQKWQAVSEAAQKSQVAFEGAMVTLGIYSYYLKSDRRANLWDPAQGLDIVRLKRLIVLATGKTVEQLTADPNSASGPLSGGNLDEVSLRKLLGMATFPDGLPVGESLHVLESIKAQDPKVPLGIFIRLNDKGLLEIRRYKQVCQCYHSEEKKECRTDFFHEFAHQPATYSYSQLPGAPGSCDTAQDCDRMFVRDVDGPWLPRACGYRYLDKAKARFRFFNQTN